MNFENFFTPENDKGNMKEGSLASYVYNHKKNTKIQPKKNTKELYENIEDVVLIFEAPFLTALKTGLVNHQCI